MLIVAFLAEEARRPLLTKLQGRGNICAEQEQAQIDTLLKWLDASTSWCKCYVRKLCLRSGRTSRRGGSPRAWSGPASRYCATLCATKRACRTLSSSCASTAHRLMGKMTLGRLSEDARLFFIFISRMLSRLAATRRVESLLNSPRCSVRSWTH
ncbi:hypothetical protein BGW80DRAFT_439246 [Lactifluus volemus]|nr:hypothetical protein BGW80DRAFT_439246 [Lactifluus volemus]